MRSAAREVLDFWLDDVGERGWFAEDDDLDRTIRDRFLPAWREATEEGIEPWLATAHDALAQVVLLDQVPRNMLRGDPRAFGSDPQARREVRIATT